MTSHTAHILAYPHEPNAADAHDHDAGEGGGAEDGTDWRTLALSVDADAVDGLDLGSSCA